MSVLPTSLPLVGSSVAFFKASVDAVVDVFCAWERRNLRRESRDIRQISLAPDWQAALRWLYPLTTHERQRSILLPCADWTLYVDNSFPHGGGQNVAGYLGEHVDCMAVSADCAQVTFPAFRENVQIVLAIHDRDPQGDYRLRRTIDYTGEGRRRRVHHRGEPLPFEGPLGATFVRSDLLHYLKALGIDLSKLGDPPAPIHAVERSKPAFAVEEYSERAAHELLEGHPSP